MIEYYSAIKKNEITACAATQMDLEMIILSQICCLYVESKKNDTNELIYKTDSQA